MNNYHYIIAGLPDLSRDCMAGKTDADGLINEIKAQCSSRDVAVIEFLEKGYVPENLTESFYHEALRHRNGFLKKWFAFDLEVRNAKVRFLNQALGREYSRDVIELKDNDGTPLPDNGGFEEAGHLSQILAGNDILARERGIDDLYWAKAEELVLFHYFDLTVILGFIARLKIIDRWLRLDEDSGREMFRSLVDEVRKTFKGVQYDAANS